MDKPSSQRKSLSPFEVQFNTKVKVSPEFSAFFELSSIEPYTYFSCYTTVIQYVESHNLKHDSFIELTPKLQTLFQTNKTQISTSHLYELIGLHLSKITS